MQNTWWCSIIEFTTSACQCHSVYMQEIWSNKHPWTIQKHQILTPAQDIQQWGKFSTKLNVVRAKLRFLSWGARHVHRAPEHWEQQCWIWDVTGGSSMTNFAYWLDELVGTLLRCTDFFQWPEIQVSFKTLVIIIFIFFNCMYNFCLHKCGILIQCDRLVSLCADWTYFFLAASFRDETWAPNLD